MTLPAWSDFAALAIDFLWWQSLFATVVFLVVAPICWLVRHRPVACYFLWSLVFVRLVLPVDLGHPFSASSLAGGLLASSRPAPESSLQVVEVGFPPEMIDAVPADDMAGWKLAVLGVWLAGVAAVLVAFGRRRAGYRRCVREARPCREARLLEVLERGRRSYGIRRQVRLLVSEERVIPFTVGVRRPIVLLPDSVAGDLHFAEVALAHELAHVARHDSLFLTFQTLIQAVYFFHPLTWLAGFHLHRQREQLCDAMALSYLDLGPKRFAEGLLAILSLRLQPAAPAALTNTPKRSLGMRIRHILVSPRRRERTVLSFFLVLLLACFLLPLSAQSKDGSAGNDTTAPGPSRGVVLRFILMSGVRAEGSQWLPKLAEKHFQDDVAVMIEGSIESIESVLRGSIGLGEDGSFSLSNESGGKTTTLSGTVVALGSEYPGQFRADLEVRVDDQLVTKPTVILLAGQPGAITTVFDGEQFAVFLLVQE